MKKKDVLSNSFSSNRSKRTKPALAADIIDQIAESREAEKLMELKQVEEAPTPSKSTISPTEALILPSTVADSVIKETPLSETATPPKTTKTKKRPLKEQESAKKRRSTEEKQILEREIKTSFDIPESIYDDMRIYLIRQKKSMREYLLDLIQKDLSKQP